MGVPRFARWLFERCGGAFATTKTTKNLAELQIDAVYIDGNALVHPASQKVTATGSYTNGGKEFIELPLPPGDLPESYRKPLPDNSTPEDIEKAIFAETCRVIEAIVFVVVPKKYVYIVFDGAPPLGKQDQQRQRRWTTAQTRSENTDNPLSVHWDSCAISPGTQFMDRLQAYMRWWVRSKMMETGSGKNYWQKLTVIIDGSNVAGEGEHKIMDYIRTSAPDSNQIIYGLDADIFMLSLATRHRHLYLLREDPFSRNRGTNSFLCKGPALDADWHVVDIDAVTYWMFLSYPQVDWRLKQEKVEEGIVDDFVFLTFLVGNDFVPPLPICQVLKTSLSLIHDAHKLLLSVCSQKSKKLSGIFITAHTKINWQVLYQLLVKLKDIESQQCWELACHQRTKSDEALVDKDLIRYFSMWFGDSASKRNQEAMHIATRNYRKAYYRRAHITTRDEINDMCAHYLQVLEWINSYYHGKLLSWRYYYPYGYAPFPSDLVQYMVSISDTPMGITPRHQFTLSESLLPFQQLMCILPSESRCLLPPEYDEALEAIPNHFPTTETVTIDTQGKEVDWQAVVTLPPLQLSKILKVYKGVSERVRVYRRNERGKARTFVWDPNIVQLYKSKWGTIGRCKVVDCAHIPDNVRVHSTRTSDVRKEVSSTVTKNTSVTKHVPPEKFSKGKKAPISIRKPRERPRQKVASFRRNNHSSNGSSSVIRRPRTTIKETRAQLMERGKLN